MHVKRRTRTDTKLSFSNHEERLLCEKYSRLSLTCTVNGVPYPVINRCVLRWLKYRKKNKVANWYPKNVEETCICIKMFIVAYNAEIYPHIFEELNKVKIAYEVAEITGFKAWFANMRG